MLRVGEQVQAILEGVIELRNQNVDLVEIQGTVEEVTADKCRRAAEAVSLTSRQPYHSIRIHTLENVRHPGVIPYGVKILYVLY